MGKGDNRRPSQISKEEYDANYEAAFGKKELHQWEDAPQVGGGDRDPSREVPPNEHDNRDVRVPSETTKAGGGTTEEGECAYCKENFDGFGVGICPCCGGWDGWLLENQDE